MESYYKIRVSKEKVFTKVIWGLFVLIIAIPLLKFNGKEIDFFLNSNELLVIVFDFVVVVINVMILFSACYNGYKFYAFNPDAELEIFNKEGYLIYKDMVNGQPLEKKIQLDSIYFIRRNYCLPFALFYDEVFYTENDKIKNVIISVTLVDKIEKKIKTTKKIKVVEEQKFFYKHFPSTIWD
jgi:fumarate reductase subunit C